MDPASIMKLILSIPMEQLLILIKKWEEETKNPIRDKQD